MTVAAGVFAPGHLGELTRLVPFEMVDEVLAATRRVQLTDQRVRRALACLSAAGRVGYDLADAGYFHRELPYDADALRAMHPRLRDAVDDDARVADLLRGLDEVRRRPLEQTLRSLQNRHVRSVALTAAVLGVTSSVTRAVAAVDWIAYEPPVDTVLSVLVDRRLSCWPGSPTS